MICAIDDDIDCSQYSIAEPAAESSLLSAES